MSLLLLFQGGTQGAAAPPAPPPTVVALAFLPHGEATIAPAASTHTAEAAGVVTIGPGGTTTIQ